MTMMMTHTEKQFLYNLGDPDWTDTWLDIIPEEILQIIYKEVFKSTEKKLNYFKRHPDRCLFYSETGLNRPRHFPLLPNIPPLSMKQVLSRRPSPGRHCGIISMCIKPAQTKSLIFKAFGVGGTYKGTLYGGARLLREWEDPIPQSVLDLVEADSGIVAPRGLTIGFGFNQFLEYNGEIFKLRKIKFENTFDETNDFTLTYTSPNNKKQMRLEMDSLDNKPFLVKNKKQFPQITIDFHATLTMNEAIESLTGYYNNPPIGQKVNKN